ncbi:MAG: hypothetical protein H0U29_11275, partial [Acidimicrobiia bacterium]|nr:hypothetical protein [Acidimicrobiia bacterium]
MHRRRLILAALSAVAVAGSLAACGSDGEGTTGKTTTTGQTTSTASTGKTTSTEAEVGPGAAYAKKGPNEVGTTSFALADGRRVVAWYPAAESAADQPEESFDIASLLTPELQSQIPAEKRPIYEIGAHPGA